MFVFFHGYSPDTWDKMLRTGLVSDSDGIRFQESIDLPEKLKFNNLAKKGGELYNIIKERSCPFYIDRLQGGCYIENYPYDTSLLDEYRNLLGDKFYGFQMHEWLSNYRSDANKKLAHLTPDEWTEENRASWAMNDVINDVYYYPKDIDNYDDSAEYVREVCVKRAEYLESRMKGYARIFNYKVS